MSRREEKMQTLRQEGCFSDKELTELACTRHHVAPDDPHLCVFSPATAAGSRCWSLSCFSSLIYFEIIIMSNGKVNFITGRGNIRREIIIS